jgi:hypothetical protein
MAVVAVDAGRMVVVALAISVGETSSSLSGLCEHAARRMTKTKTESQPDLTILRPFTNLIVSHPAGKVKKIKQKMR